MTNDDDQFGDIFKSIRDSAVPPDASVIAVESNRRKTQRDRTVMLAVAALLTIGGVGIFAALSNTEPSELATRGPLAEPGSLSSTTTSVVRSVLQERFEANAWRIVGQQGFKTTAPDGLVTFEQFGVDDIITLELLPCGRWGGHPIEWNDEGFVLTDSANAEGGVGTIDIGCGPGDDLFDLLAGGIGPDQFIVEISGDGTTATVTKGELVLELAPVATAIALSTTTAVPPTTEATTTTTTDS